MRAHTNLLEGDDGLVEHLVDLLLVLVLQQRAEEDVVLVVVLVLAVLHDPRVVHLHLHEHRPAAVLEKQVV